MRLAVIDCGTNTFNLIIIETGEGKNYSKLFKTRIPVKLGEGAINKGFIAPAPFDRGLEAIQEFDELVRKHKVEKVLAFATSAIRDAANGAEFVETVKQKFGIDIEVIDGDREAELIYLGISEALRLSNQVSLIMDIGGGSTEFILAVDKKILWKKSFQLGAARLLEKFMPSDPIAAAEIKSIYGYLQAQLEPLFEMVKQYAPVELIGSSGVFDSLVEMIHGELKGEPFIDSKIEYHVDLDQYFKISDLVKQSTLAQRRKIKGLAPMRFDMIVISCLMIDFILQSFRLSGMRVSVYSLKEGALADFIHKQL